MTQGNTEGAGDLVQFVDWSAKVNGRRMGAFIERECYHDFDSRNPGD
jgi:hypothetical protein